MQDSNLTASAIKDKPEVTGFEPLRVSPPLSPPWGGAPFPNHLAVECVLGCWRWLFHPRHPAPFLTAHGLTTMGRGVSRPGRGSQPPTRLAPGLTQRVPSREPPTAHASCSPKRPVASRPRGAHRFRRGTELRTGAGVLPPDDASRLTANPPPSQRVPIPHGSRPRGLTGWGGASRRIRAPSAYWSLYGRKERGSQHTRLPPLGPCGRTNRRM